MPITIDPKTTPVSFQTYTSITDSKGLFKTWTDIFQGGQQEKTVAEEVTQSLIVNPIDITGDNVIVQWNENKNVLPFNNDITKWNNVLTQNKYIMYLTDNYMLPLQVNLLDEHSLVEWGELISDAVSSMEIAKQDIINQQTIKEVSDVCIATGNVWVYEGCDAMSVDWDQNKKLGAMITRQRIENRTHRTKYSKGFQQSLERMLLSSSLSLNMLTGLTASSASDKAFDATKNRFQINTMFGHNYETAPMYLGKNIGMSEWKADGGTINNVGANTGNLIRPYHFADLHGLLFYTGSVKSYGHTFRERVLPLYNNRMIDVITKVYRYNVAVLPIYAPMNKALFSKIPTTDAWTDIEGKVHPARDYSKASDYNALINELFTKQSGLYSAFGWNGSSNIEQSAITQMRADATVDWKGTKTKTLSLEPIESLVCFSITLNSSFSVSCCWGIFTICSWAKASPANNSSDENANTLAFFIDLHSVFL